MSLTCKGVFVVGAKRTPFCGFGGALRETPASHAFAATAKDAIQTARLDPTLIDNTVVGNVHYLSQCDGGKTPRYCGIYSGVPIDRPALGVNKACGSGLQAIITGALDILTGLGNVSLTGGTEVMSALPFLVKNTRFGTTLGKNYHLEDYIQKQVLDSYSGLTLEKLAEDLATKYGLCRRDVDEYAAQSHLRWKTAQESNIFDDEITKLTLTVKKKQVVVNKDDLPQPNISMESLGELSGIVEGGSVVTTGNSSLCAFGLTFRRLPITPNDLHVPPNFPRMSVLPRLDLSKALPAPPEIGTEERGRRLSPARACRSPTPLHLCVAALVGSHGSGVIVGHLGRCQDDVVLAAPRLNLSNSIFLLAPADGAAAVVIANEATIEQHRLSPLARVAAWSCIGSNPLRIDLGAILAVRKLLDITGLNVDQVDLYELNETFASQALVGLNELKIDRERVNTDGGSIAMGNPVGATGARMAVHLVHQLRRRQLKRGVVASSCGGGQGIAILIETV